MFMLHRGDGVALVFGKGTITDSILKLSGATNAAGTINGNKKITPEAVLSLPATAVMIVQQDLNRFDNDPKILFQRTGAEIAPAVQQNRVIITDLERMTEFGMNTIQVALELYRKYQAL